MNNFKLDSTNDIIIGRGATRTDGVDYVAQLVENRLSTVLGEWELDSSVGVPWNTSILVKGVDMTLIRGLIYDTIASTPGVASVGGISLSPDYNERKLYISFTARAVGGLEFNVTGANYGRR